MVRTVAVLLALCSLAARAAAVSSEAQRYLDAAVALYERLDYEDALEQLDRAKLHSNGLQDDVLIGLYRGAVLADMGRPDDADAAFRTALYLDPEARLPIAVSPKVTQVLEAIRKDVRADLARRGRSASAEAARTPAQAPSLVKAPPSATRRWAWAPAAAGAAGVVGGVVFALLAKGDYDRLANASPPFPDASSAQGARDDGKVFQSVSVTLFAVGAAALATGAAMYFLGQGSESPSVAVAAGPGGGWAGVRGEFP